MAQSHSMGRVHSVAQRGEPKELSDIVKRPGRCRKEKRKKSDHGRIAFYEHGGKTGRATVKYPLYKKNAQRSVKVRIPRFHDRAARPLNNHMHYYYIMTRRGRRTFCCYVRLTHRAADLIHDLLEAQYDMVQVCDVEPDQVDADLLLHK